MALSVPTKSNAHRRRHGFRRREALQRRHRNLIPQTNSQPERDLSAEVPRLRGVDFEEVDQSGAQNGDQPTAKLDGLQQAGLSHQDTADDGPKGIEGHERKAIDPTLDSRHAMNRLEVDGEVKQDHEIGQIGTGGAITSQPTKVRWPKHC